MNKRRLVDTNLIIRHLVQDSPRQAKVAGRLFEACDRGALTIVMLPVVVAESIFVLESFYKYARPDIARVIAGLVRSPGIELADLAVHLDALNRYSHSTMHFVDCMIAAAAAALGLPVATFDSDCKKFPELTIDLD